jgi:outer membrane protein assembly factor BamB
MKAFRSARRVGVSFAAFALLSVVTVRADTIAYISNTVGNDIETWDLTTNTMGVLTTSAGGSGPTGTIDSLTFVSGTELIYSIIGASPGQIGVYTCTAFAVNGTCSGTSTNAELTLGYPPVNPNGQLNMPADLAVDPSSVSAGTFLVASSGSNTIFRINYSTGQVVTSFNFGMRPDGIAYVGNELFVVLGENEIAQIDPGTGAIIKTLALPTPGGALTPQADGLTYDASNGYLYVASDDGGIYQVNTALTTQVYTQVLTPANTVTNEFDGITSLGNTIYIINRDQHGDTVSLNPSTGAVGGIVLTSPFDSGADDIAAAGEGPSISNSPEPSTTMLIGAGLLMIGLAKFTRRNRASRNPAVSAG